jgi:hypothetical protein
MTYSFRVRVARPLAPLRLTIAPSSRPQGYAWSSARAPLQLVAHSSRWMAGEGVAPLTVRGYVRVAQPLQCAVSAGEGLDLQRQGAAEASGFVREECRRHSVGSTKHLVAALRSLLRFWHVEGHERAVGAGGAGRS